MITERKTITLNEYAMTIDFEVYLDVNERELSCLEDGEILAKFISLDSYNEMIEDTGLEDYSYSDFLGVFESVKPILQKILSQWREN